MNRHFTMLFLYSVFLLAACESESDKVVVDETAEDQWHLGDYYIDDRGNEGILAYASSSYSTPGYAIVISLDEAFLPWGATGNQLFPASSTSTTETTSPTFGLLMLQNARDNDIHRYPAIYWCDQKNPQDKSASVSSWRLPTRQELRLIFTDKNGYGMSSLNARAEIFGGTSYSLQKRYWTCEEDLMPQDADLNDYDPANRAIPANVNIETPDNKNLWLKKNSYYVRAIKYIYYKSGY